jgi:ATP-dependent DNA helicase RecG
VTAQNDKVTPRDKDREYVPYSFTAFKDDGTNNPHTTTKQRGNFMELTSLKYISEKREKDLNKLNIYTIEDLCKHFPRDYLDLTKVTKVSEAYHNDIILTLCEVLNFEVNRYARRPYVKALCQQGEYMFNVIWFNQPYIASKLDRGEYLFYGRVQNKYGMGCTMINPSLEKAEGSRNLKGIIPVYSLSGSLTQGVVRVAIKQALTKVKFVSHIPFPLQKKYELMPLDEAYIKVHCPKSKAEAQEGAARIALEEYFLLISAFKVIKGGREDARLNFYPVTREQLKGFTSRFPFEFTNGQKEAVEDIWNNLHSPHRMNRLLQGDVGSGKTAVALTGIYMAVKSGYQAAMIAPTEVLARQNAALCERYFPDFKVCTLTGSTPAAEKRVIKSGLASGEVNIVCGTHAVIQNDVTFKNLSFVVCDEQHPFRERFL